VNSPLGDLGFVALLDESALAAEAMAFGATVLGRANYAHQGYYAQAFFSLSVGLERCGKLALVLDHALTNGGSFPSKKTLKTYGHDLQKLLAETEAIASKHGLGATRPASTIHDGIVSTLTDFATNATRYYNLELLAGDPLAVSQASPIASWHRDVSQPIASTHYSDDRRKKDEQKARTLEAFTGSLTSVRFRSEAGDLINSVFEGSRRTAERNAVVPWERMYVMQFGRFFGSVLSELAYQAQAAGMLIPYLFEFFGIFNNDDSYFRSRRTWSIYSP
jgi:hypothetical protein